MKFGQFASVGQSMSGTFLPLVLLSFTAMVSSCIAYGCTNRSKSGCGRSFFRFPLKKPELLAKWVQAIHRKKLVSKQLLQNLQWPLWSLLFGEKAWENLPDIDRKCCSIYLPSISQTFANKAKKWKAAAQKEETDRFSSSFLYISFKHCIWSCLCIKSWCSIKS